jgi:hypothetical protein
MPMGSGAIVRPFLTSALVAREMPASRSDRFLPRKDSVVSIEPETGWAAECRNIDVAPRYLRAMRRHNKQGGFLSESCTKLTKRRGCSVFSSLMMGRYSVWTLSTEFGVVSNLKEFWNIWRKTLIVGECILLLYIRNKTQTLCLYSNQTFSCV